MTHRKIAAITMLLLAAFGAAVQAGEEVTSAAGIKHVRLRVAGIVAGSERIT